jgi:signal transduction histidine kinase
MVLVPNSAICIVHRTGLPYACTQGADGLAIPPTGTVKRVGSYSVGSFPIQNTSQSFDPLFIEYARDRSGLDDTISRLWLFLGLGVLGGTGLAFLAGLMVARRAMRPVRALTGAARNVAATRDPAQAVPQPEAQDEIAELARTLDEMLKELDAARSETEQMVQTQREFVADASHELRTPLTSILANLELLQAQLDDAQREGEEGEIVGSALRSSRRMGRLVSDLLLLARADAGRTSPRRDCDLAEIAAAALSELRPVANGHELVLAAEGPVPVEGNPDELHRLAVNLLDNGLRHTPAGTAIEMSVDRQNGLAVLEVTDDGPGLPQGMEEQVFARFVRGGGPADVAGDSGVGLGLAIVKAVATSHGGEVEAGASTGGGARFTVRLPVGKS